jgi:hypothetical protein
MKVFVWVNWGDVSVHAADTYEQCAAIFNKIDDLIYELDMRFADECRKVLGTSVGDARPELRAAIVRDEIKLIMDRFYHSRHRVFDPGTGFYDVE